MISKSNAFCCWKAGKGPDPLVPKLQFVTLLFKCRAHPCSQLMKLTPLSWLVCLFSFLACWIMYWKCKEKLRVSHYWHLKDKREDEATERSASHRTVGPSVTSRIQLINAIQFVFDMSFIFDGLYLIHWVAKWIRLQSI